MVKINLRKDEIVLCVLDYLKQTGLIQAMRALEHETGITTTNYGTDLDFLRGLILDAQFDDAESFVVPLANVDDFDADRVLFEIRRQRFLELVDGNEGEAAQHVLSTTLKQLESKCSRAEWHKLCYCLTLQSLADHPDYEHWTPYRGRMDTFESLRREFDRALSNQWSQQREKINKLNPNHLVTLLQQSALYQASSYLAENSNRTLPNPMFFDLLSPSFTPMDSNGRPAGPSGRDLSSRSDVLSGDVMRKAQQQMGFDPRVDGQNNGSNTTNSNGNNNLGSSQYPMPNVTVMENGMLSNPRKALAAQGQNMRSSWAGSLSRNNGSGIEGVRRRHNAMQVSSAPPVPPSSFSSSTSNPIEIKKPVSWEVPLGVGDDVVESTFENKERMAEEEEEDEEEVAENETENERPLSQQSQQSQQSHSSSSSKISEVKVDNSSEKNGDVATDTRSDAGLPNYTIPSTVPPTTASSSSKTSSTTTTTTTTTTTAGREKEDAFDSKMFAKFQVFSEVVESHAVRAVAISPDGTRIAIGTNGRNLKVVATPSLEHAKNVFHSATKNEENNTNEDGSSVMVKPRIITEHSKLHLGK